MLSNNDEEADTKICMHAKAADTSNGNVVIRASDTDIAVFCCIIVRNSAAISGWMSVLHPSVIGDSLT